MEKTIEQRVLEVVKKLKNDESLTIEPNQAISELLEDSLDQVSLLFDIEDEFGISIPDGVENLKTFADVVHGVEMLLASKEKVQAEEISG